MRPVLIAHDEPEDFRDLLIARFPDVEFVYATTARGVVEALAQHDPEVAFSIKHPGFPSTAHTPISAHPSVRWIQIGGSGFDHLAPWDARRVTVTNGAGVLAPYLAESVTGGMLALGCGFLNYVEQQRARQWNPVAFTPLRDRTLLVVGFGRIGECVARNAKALGMRVLAIRGTPAPHPAADEMHGPDALHALLPRADFVSLHVRLNEATRGLISRGALAAMKPGAYLVNTSRGPVVDEAALIDTLRFRPSRGHVSRCLRDRAAVRRKPALGDAQRTHHPPRVGQHTRLAAPLRGALRGQPRPLARRRAAAESGDSVSMRSPARAVVEGRWCRRPGTMNRRANLVSEEIGRRFRHAHGHRTIRDCGVAEVSTSAPLSPRSTVLEMK